MAIKNLKIESYIEYVKLNQGIRTNYDIVTAGNLTVLGTLTAGQEVIGAETITSSSANAFAVGRLGTTNPVFNVNASATTVATGITVVGAAAASGVAVSAISSGTNENLTIDAKGSGTLALNTVATGSVITSAPVAITSASANALAVGLAGTTNPAFNVDASTASSVTGVNIQSRASGAGVAVTAISSGTNENLVIGAKGSGVITLGATGSAGVTVRSNNATAFTVGPNSATNPTILINASAGSAATGFSIIGNPAASGVALQVISSGTNENGTISAKGTGTITINSGTSLAAGGSQGAGVLISSSAGLGFFGGTGVPTFSALNGSLYVNTTATTAATRLYVNNSGSGTTGTTWTAFTAAA